MEARVGFSIADVS